MLRRVRLVDGDVEFGAAADEPFATLQPRVVHRVGIEALAGEELETAILTLQIDRADLGDHDAGDLMHDAVEAYLAVTGLGHDLPKTPHDHAQRRLGSHDSGLVASSRLHKLLPFRLPPSRAAL